jgi:hypothetical protein
MLPAQKLLTILDSHPHLWNFTCESRQAPRFSAIETGFSIHYSWISPNLKVVKPGYIS